MKNSQTGYRYLLKNIGLLTLSQFTTKFLSFFLIPLYTNVLSTNEYGTYDLFNTTIGLLIPILTLSIQEAVIRFSIDNNTNKSAIATISFRYLLRANILVIIIVIINKFFHISLLLSEYSIYFICMFFTQSVAGLLACYVRGTDKIKEISISSVISSLVTICFNILFLVVLNLGLKGYFIANILGPLVQILYLLVCSNYLLEIKISKYPNETKEMTNYSKPLIANNVAWWVNSLSDRYVIVFFRGLAENGIYSVAGKIPQIINLLQSVFNQAWILSAVKEYDLDDKSNFFTNTYNIYNTVLVTLCSLVIIFDKVLARVLYAKEFYGAWIYVPWLTIAIVFGALSGYIDGFFSTMKDSKLAAKSTVIGATINILLNIIFVPFFGSLCAAIATSVSYFVVWFYRYKQSKKYIKLKNNLKRDIFVYIILVVQIFILYCFESIVSYLVLSLLFTIICIANFDVWKLFLTKLIFKMRGRGFN